MVPDHAIPEDLCVGRTFLDLPHLALLRFDDECSVEPRKSTLGRIRRTRSECPRAMVEVTILPGTAALVKAATEQSSAVVVRAPERDLVFHSDPDGLVQLPIGNRGQSGLTIRVGEKLGRCKIIPEGELVETDVPSRSSAEEIAIASNRVADRKKPLVGCTRRIKPEELSFGPALTEDQRSELMELINEFPDVFSFTLQDLGCTDLMEATVKLKPDGVPSKSKPYRLAPPDREFKDDQIRSWRDAGIVTDT